MDAIPRKNQWILLLSLIFVAMECGAYEDVLPRFALVIGNGNYQFSALKNPVNDAKDIASTLRTLRYDVTVAVNQTPSQMRKVVTDFYSKIKQSNAVSLFYYAGHAIQSNNINYLIPINAQIDSYDRMKSQAFSINELLKALKQASSNQNIIILEACRKNPIEINTKNENKRGLVVTDEAFLNLPGGLAPVEAPTGTLIAYATEPGRTASDGKGRNGTYTSALLRHIGKSETAEALFKKVRKDVLNATRNQQTPWEHSSLIETFYFMPPSNEEIPDIPSF